jgi:hypothetical protein
MRVELRVVALDDAVEGVLIAATGRVEQLLLMPGRAC